MRAAGFTLLMVIFATAAAQDKPAQKPESAQETPAATMPSPPPEIGRLANLLIGTWGTTEKHEPSPWSPQGGEGKGLAIIKTGPGNMSIVEDYASNNAQGRSTGHGVIWWDPKAGGYRSLWCDNLSPVCDVRQGVWKWEGNNLVVQDEMEMMGRKTALRTTYSNLTPNAFTWTMEGGAPGEKLKPWLSIQYVRGVPRRHRP
jgi:hypothetical protein